MSNIFRPDLINFDRLDPADHIGNLNNAFDIADKHLGIPKILDAEGTLAMPELFNVAALSVPYISNFFHLFYIDLMFVIYGVC